MNTDEIKKLVRPNILSLVPYSTARDDFKGELGIFLDANESPYNTGWNRYPDPHQLKLKAKLASLKHINVSNLFLGNGSDEAIDIIYRVFCRPSVDNVVIISPSYGMYSVCAEINDIDVRFVELEKDFSCPVDKLLQACDCNTKVMFLCSPNNPSGNSIAKEDILKILNTFQGILVVDEAYIDFSCNGTLTGLISEYPNLVILQTCSKARGLAALRLGLAIADEYIITLMSEVKYPYNISDSTQRAAFDALDRDVEKDVKEIISERKRVAELLPSFKTVQKVYPSDANFLLVKFDDADKMYDFLISRGIIVRNRNKVPLCEGCLRLTIGLKSENDKMIETIKEYEKSSIH